MTSERDVTNLYLWNQEILPKSKKWEKVGLRLTSGDRGNLSGHVPLLHVLVLSCAVFLDHNFLILPILRELSIAINTA